MIGSSKGWIPTVTIGIDKESIKCFDPVLTYTMIESMVYFDASRPVLDALQKLGANNDLPFSDILLGRRQTGEAFPAYLLQPTTSKLGNARSGGGYLMKSQPQPVEKEGWDMTRVFPNFERINGTKFWDPVSKHSFPSLPSDRPLNNSQEQAIKLALSNSFAVIQGPPGNSYILSKIYSKDFFFSYSIYRKFIPIHFLCDI